MIADAKLIPKEEVAENNRASAGAVGLAVLANFSPDPAELDESAVESLEMLARAALEANAELCVQASILAGPAATVEQAVESCLATPKNGGSLKGISNASSVLWLCGHADSSSSDASGISAAGQTNCKVCVAGSATGLDHRCARREQFLDY
jgi:hypothetical protein